MLKIDHNPAGIRPTLYTLSALSGPSYRMELRTFSADDARNIRAALLDSGKAHHIATPDFHSVAFTVFTNDGGRGAWAIVESIVGPCRRPLD